jgi:hypothetical protein
MQIKQNEFLPFSFSSSKQETSVGKDCFSSYIQQRYWVIFLLLLQANGLVLAQEFDIAVKEGYAPITGYLQTPSGGESGTSDKKRPTFKELGVDDTTYIDVDFQYKMNKYIPYIALRFMNVDSSGVLESDLTTRGQSFLKGQSYSFDSSFNFYNLGLKRDFKYLTAKIEASCMDFNYDLKSTTALAERSYMKTAVRAGAEKSITIDQLDILVEASNSVPFSNTPYIFTLGTQAKYWLAEHFNIGVDVEYFYLDYEDNQDLPNHLRLEMQPALSVFLQYQF